MFFNHKRRFEIDRICLIVCIFTGAIGAVSQSAFANWSTTGPLVLTPSIATTITLSQSTTNSSPTATPELWLMNEGETELIHPEMVSYNEGAAHIPVFVRGTGSGKLTIFDTASQTTATFPWIAPAESESGAPWFPRLEFASSDNLSLTYANQKVTATLTLSGGSGEMPPTAHISATDSKGRLTLSRFFPTFDLLAGEQTISLPAAGYYDLSLKLLSDPVTSLPRALESDSIPIPFGKTLTDLDLPTETADGVTTTAYIGTVITLEELPTTSSVVAEDRMQLAVFARHSKEIQRNKWPFSISGADLIDIPLREHKTRGTEYLHWQRRLGSSFAPVTVDWADVQKDTGRFSYSQTNPVFQLHRQRMVRPLVTVTGRSAWDESLPTDTTASLSAWIRFTGLMSEMYSKQTWGFQVWDNPEETWPDPSDYTRMIEASLTGYATRNGERIPTPQVIVGGVDSTRLSYIDDALTTEIAQRVGLSFKFRQTDYSKTPSQAGLTEAMDAAQAILARHEAPENPVYIHGVGYPNGPGGLSQALQANYLVRAYVVAISKNAYKLSWDSLYDRSAVPWDNNPSSRTGLLDTDLKPKLSGVAYNIMTYMMSGATPDGVTTQGSAVIYKFNLPIQDNKWPGSVYVAWTESPDQVHDIQLEMTHGGGVYALDYLGAEVHAQKVAADSANSIEGSYQIPVGFDPVFIWDAGKRGDTGIRSPENQ